jgi:hypothetical protein
MTQWPAARWHAVNGTTVAFLHFDSQESTVQECLTPSGKEFDHVESTYRAVAGCSGSYADWMQSIGGRGSTWVDERHRATVGSERDKRVVSGRDGNVCVFAVAACFVASRHANQAPAGSVAISASARYR